MKITRDGSPGSGIRWVVEVSEAEMRTEPVAGFLAWVQTGLDLFSVADEEENDGA